MQAMSPLGRPIARWLRHAVRVSLAVAVVSVGATAYAAWQKEGATAEEAKKDQSQCEIRARSDSEFGRFDPSGPGTRAGATLRGANDVVREGRSFELCMRERGYEWVDAKTPAKKPEGATPAK